MSALEYSYVAHFKNLLPLAARLGSNIFYSPRSKYWFPEAIRGLTVGQKERLCGILLRGRYPVARRRVVPVLDKELFKYSEK
jgi:hypothetical protein